MNYTSQDYSDFLAHHGIEGQKWGVQNGPPYPLDPEKRTNKAKEAAKKLAETGKSIVKKSRASSAEAAKKRATKKEEADEKKAIRKAKSDAKKEAKAAKEAAKEKEFKDKVVRDGDIKTLSKNREKFTDQELAQCLARYQLNTKLDTTLDPNSGKTKMDQVKDSVDTVKSVVDTAKKVADITKTGLDAYNTTAQVVNSITGQEKMKVLKFEKKEEPGRTFTRNYDKDGNLTRETKEYTIGKDKYRDTYDNSSKGSNGSKSKTEIADDVRGMAGDLTEESIDMMTDLIYEIINKKGK